VPGVLPDWSAGEAMSMMSSEIWNAMPIFSPNRRSASMRSWEAPENIAP
jgi:hypothetical protein